MTKNRIVLLLATLVLVLAVAVSSAGCASQGSATATAASSTSIASTTSVPTPTTNPASGDYAQQLKDTAQAIAQLGGSLEEKGSADPDLTAQIYGLRLRSQAIVAARALVDQDPQLADDAATQMRQLLNRALAVASPAWNGVLEAVSVKMQDLTTPSADPTTARGQLDVITQLLAPLMPPDTADGS